MKRYILLWIACLLFGWIEPALAQAPVNTGYARVDTASLYVPHQLIVKFKSATTTKGFRTEDASFRIKYDAFKQLGVRRNQKLHPETTLISNSNKSKLHNSKSSKSMATLSLIYRIELDSKTDLEKAIQLLKKQPDVEYVEPVYQHFPLDVYIPNDPQAQPTGQYYLSNIKAYDAWAIEKGNAAVTIGFVDFGFIPIHEDLAGNIQYNYADPVDGVDNDMDGYVDNFAGWNVGNNNSNIYPTSAPGVHGTWTAGIAAAVADNNIGIAGTGFNCKFLPVKGEGVASDGTNTYTYFDGYNGIIYAAWKGSKVINLSWGRPGAPSLYEEDIINTIINTFDVVIVAAAGNDNNEVMYWPASYDKVISVAGTDWDERDKRWQSYDPKIGSNYNEKVDICAPSEYITTTSYHNPTATNPNYAYYYDARSGTSMAAPQVSAAAALIRSKYPSLTADEVKNRLLATADNIDALNPGFAGKLGRGRLNIDKALAVTSSLQAISLEQRTITNQQGQPFIVSGDKASIAIHLKSMYGTFSNLQVELTSMTSGVAVTKSTSGFPAFSKGQTVNNLATPFEVQADASLGANTQATFRIDLTDGAFTHTQYFMVVINPEYVTIQNNQVSLTVSNKGRFGYDDDFLGWTEKGTGFTYKGNNLLFEGGLLVGTNAAQVSNSIMSKEFQNFYYGNTYLYYEIGKDAHFSPSGHFNTFQSSAKDIEVRGTFTDTIKSINPSPIGVKVAQRNYTWHNDKFIIIEYQVTNVSTAEIPALYTGISANFDIQSAENNQANWDAAHNMGYMFNKNSRNLYAGVQLLTKQPVQYYIIDHISGINLIDDFQFTTAEKFTSLSSGIIKNQSTAGAQDIQQTLSAQIVNLKPGETRTVAFAFLAGDNLADLQASAGIAQNKFNQLKTSPVPVISNLEVCKDDNALLAPKNGQNFRLYNSFPLTTPIATGNTFLLGKVTTDSTYYITSVDSLYESQPVSLQVKPVTHTTIFDMAQDTLGIYEGDVLQLIDRSAGAIKWLWNFGDTFSSTAQHPTHTYATPGKYTIKLITENKNGCRDTLTKEVLVVNGIKSLLPVIPDKVQCNAEKVVLTPSNGIHFNLYAQLPLTTPLASGQSFSLERFQRDTVFYVTCTDFLLESEPVAVHIRVSTHSTRFELSSDTLDLRLQQLLQTTDKSEGSVKWQWNFGDGQTSTAQHPTHTYALPGEYTVTLVTKNEAGCENTFSEKVVVLQTTGIENQRDDLITVYPNPANAKVKISLIEGFDFTGAEIEIVNLLGQKIYQATLEGRQLEVDLSSCKRGQYIIHIKGSGKNIIRKLILL